jgi:hypothetical protein
MINKKTWINVLPMYKWTALYNAEGERETKFMLDHYEVVQGVPRLIFKLNTDELIETGVAAVALTKNLSVRLYVPIELHRVPGIGFSPKIVYIIPKDYTIQQYRAGEVPKPEPTREEKIYEAARKHTINLKG